MILSGSHRTTVSPAGMFAIGLFALCAVPAWSAGQDAGSEPPVEVQPSVGDVEVIDIPVVVVEPETVLELSPQVVEGEIVLEISPQVADGGTVLELSPQIAVDGAFVGSGTQKDDNKDKKVRKGSKRRTRRGGSGAAGSPSPEDLFDRGSGGALPGGVAGLPGGPGGLPADLPDGAGDRRRIERMEKNIQKLEESLQAVLSELRALKQGWSSGVRGVSSTSGRRRTRSTSTSKSVSGVSGMNSSGTTTSRQGTSLRRRTGSSRSRSAAPGASGGWVNPLVEATTMVDSSMATSPGADPFQPGRSPYATHVRILTRVTYKLPGGKAEALASFLRENVAAELEIKAEGDTVTVTTAATIQQTIQRLIEILLPGKPRRAARGGDDASGGVQIDQ